MTLWTDWHLGLPFWRAPGRLELLAAFIDGTLELGEAQRIAEHVRTCRACLRVLHQASALLTAGEAGQQV